MNVEVSRRVGAVMSVMTPSLTVEQRAEVASEVLKAESFESLPSWIRRAVIRAEETIGVVKLSNFESVLPITL